jgi:two-component system response regulator AtoC
VPIDVRIVAATNRDLEEAVREKAFREDLLYRLNVIRIHVPPLRERTEDIPLLARHFLDLHARRLGRRLEGLSPAALATLTAYPFPGNVRELSNVLEQAVALAAGPLIDAGDLPERVRQPERIAVPRSPVVPTAPLREAVGTAEQEQILRALRETSWNVSRAALMLGVSRNTLRYRMEKYGLRQPSV